MKKLNFIGYMALIVIAFLSGEIWTKIGLTTKAITFTYLDALMVILLMLALFVAGIWGSDEE